MQIEQPINSWTDISLVHMFYAFRKAKADCYFDRNICIARKFAEYERNLHANLTELAKRLRDGEIDVLLQENIGKSVVAAKKLSRSRKQDHATVGHAYFSDPRRAFKNISESYKLTPEFRLIGDFPVAMHVLSALWVNHAGHEFDKCLDHSAYASRVRRVRQDANAEIKGAGPYHIEAIGSFQPYFTPFRRWRSDGLTAMREELNKDEAIVAVSLDIKSYYHNIDPTFLALPTFQEAVGVSLMPWQREFTAALAVALSAWSNNAGQQLASLANAGRDNEVAKGGLPIGLSAVRIISNVLLKAWDRAIQQNLAPVFYGRYVDDMFLVLKDPGNLNNSADLMEFIEKRMDGLFQQEPNALGKAYGIKFDVAYQGNSKLLFQEGKHKVFFLRGRAGVDLLESIEEEIASVASERRLMPDPKTLESSMGARVLAATTNASDEADTLRRADGLAVRRLGWAIQLRKVETFARDLKSEDWKETRLQFYSFALNHVLRPDCVLDHVDNLPRLLSLAVALEDWTEALDIYRYFLDSIKQLEEECRNKPTSVNGHELELVDATVWANFITATQCVCLDAVLRAYRWRNQAPVALPEAGQKLVELLDPQLKFGELNEIVMKLRLTDWAKVPYKDHVRRDWAKYRLPEENEPLLAQCYSRIDDLSEFLKSSISSVGIGRTRSRLRNPEGLESQAESLLPYLFVTRPYTPQEIALYQPDCIRGRADASAAQIFARFVRAVRGTWVKPNLVEASSEGKAASKFANDEAKKRPPMRIDLGSSRMGEGIRLGITSIYTSQNTWRLGAYGTPDIGVERYARIAHLVNQALNCRPRPTHLLLPELSLPERWINSVGERLADAGISLIAGLDYVVNRKVSPKQIHSEALLLLVDNRLGFSTLVEIRQQKSLPAPMEDEELVSKFGCNWNSDSDEKPIYCHNGLHFGLLVCSELQNISHREHFRGYVDALIVPCWNKDLETFSALVESGALDVHGYIALVNNRMFGDSRVRSPAKRMHERDLCRIRGGENDYVVVVELDVNSLRAFQSRAKNWPREEDPFKPVPEGFPKDPKRMSLPR